MTDRQQQPAPARRSFLRGLGGVAAAAALAPLASCGTGSSRSASATTKGKTLTVRNSGGTYGDANRTALYDAFTKETGITVQVVNLEYAQMLAQIQQGRPQFDLIDDSMGDYLRFAQQNALEKLDYERLKNFKSAKLASHLATEYSVGKNYWATLMAYRTDVFHSSPPQSWADFWNTGRFPGSRSLESPDADLPELEFALLADGVPVDKLYPIDVDRAFRAMTRIRSSVKKFWDTGALPGVLLGRQEVVLSTVWNGRLDALIKQGVPLAYQWNGARRQSNGWGIPKGTGNLDAAYRLIDFSLRPDVQANFARTYPMGPVVPAAYDQLSASERANLASSPEHLASGFDLDVEWWIKNEDAVSKRWVEWSNA